MVRASIPRCPSCENVIPLKKLGGGRTKCKQRSWSVRVLPSDRRKIIRNQQQHLFRIRLCEVQILTHLLGQIMLSACRRSMFWLKYDACLLLCNNLIRSRTMEIGLHGKIELPVKCCKPDSARHSTKNILLTVLWRLWSVSRAVRRHPFTVVTRVQISYRSLHWDLIQW